MSEPEKFSWTKLLSGAINPLTTAKLVGFAIHLVLILIVIWGLVVAFNFAKGLLFGSKAEKSPIAITENNGTSNVETGSDRRAKYCLFFC